MPQRIVISQDGQVSVIETGPLGPQGPVGVADPEAVEAAINVAVEEAVDSAGLVLTGDTRLNNQRTPLDESVTLNKTAPALRDPAAGTPGLRTLGTAAIQAAPGTLVATVAGKENAGVAATLVGGKEDVGVAAATVNALPETVDSDTIAIDDTTSPGFVSFHNKATRLPANGLASFGSNVTTENNMLSSALVLPANYFDSNHLYEFEFSGTITRSTSGTPNATLRVKFGGVTFYKFDLGVLAANASLRRFRSRGLFSMYSFSGWRLAGNAEIAISAPGPNGTGGYDLGQITVASEAVTIDPTIANAVTITQQWSVAHVDNVVNLYPGIIRRIKA